MRRAITVVLVGLASCGGGQKSGSSTPPPAPAPDTGPTLFVAGEAGLQEVGLDAHVMRTLTRTPARMPRFVPGSTDLLFVAFEPFRLKRIGRDGQNERDVAVLRSTFTVCPDAIDVTPGQSYETSSLGIQSDDDFELDASGARVCFWLMDRNINMGDFRIELRVDLASGAVAELQELPDGCAPVGDPPPSCAPLAAPPAPAPPADPPRVYAVEEGALLMRENGQTTTVVELDENDNFNEGPHSPSGRWVLIDGHLVQGDYIYRDVYLLDRHAGTIHPVRSGAWPAALTPAQLPRLDAPEVPTMSIVGESSVRWLPGLGRDVLVIDALLITPGVGAVELPGDLAY